MHADTAKQALPAASLQKHASQCLRFAGVWAKKIVWVADRTSGKPRNDFQ